MTDKLIRIKTVIDMTGKSRSAIYADIANSCFPKSIHIGARSVAWSESAITAWIQAMINAAPLKPKPKTESEWAAIDRKVKAEREAKGLIEREEI